MALLFPQPGVANGQRGHFQPIPSTEFPSSTPQSRLIVPGHRLHVRVIVPDGRRAFIGSQSLRALELDKRREVGVFVKGAAIVKEINNATKTTRPLSRR
jgi:phosphatidylserine/phosphatidylglycerophosphate/cardiolipin synthase-like enzyme